MNTIYTQSHFSPTDQKQEIDFIKRYSFGTLISKGPSEELVFSKAPFILKKIDSEIFLEGHLALANSHVQTLEKSPHVTISFDGPHGYVSPLWYETPQKSVPTWNYTTVLIQGETEIIRSKEWILNSVFELTKKHEPHLNWENMADQNYLDQIVGAIVGIKVKVQNIKSKFKLSQNKPQETRGKIIENLEKINKVLAAEMRNL